MDQIAIIDDHPLFSTGLSLLLEELGRPIQVSTFVSTEEFFHALTTDYSLIILDYYLPGHDFSQTIQAIKEAGFTNSIVVVSASPSPTDKKTALAMGAAAFVAKHSHPDELLKTIAEVLDGGVDLDQQENAAVAVPLQASRLSQRQTEILLLVTKGYSNKEIARSLSISPETVKTHMKTIFQRIKVKNRIEAIEYLREHGVI